MYDGGTYLRRLWKQKPQAWGPLRTVTSTAMDYFAHHIGERLHAFDPVWRGKKEAVNGQTGTLFGSGSTYTGQGLSLPAALHGVTSNRFISSMPMVGDAITFGGVVRVRSVPTGYTATYLGLQYSTSTRAYAGLVATPSGVFVRYMSSSSYKYDTAVLPEFPSDDWHSIVIRAERSTKTSFSARIKNLKTGTLSRYGHSAGHNFIAAGITTYDHYRFSGSINYTSFYDVSSDHALFFIFNTRLPDDGCLWLLNHPFAAIQKPVPVTYSVPGPTPAGPTPVIVNKQTAASGGGPTATVTMPAVTAGNILVGCLLHSSSATRSFTFSDDKANEWSSAGQAGNVRQSEIEYAVSGASGDTVVRCTINVSDSVFSICVFELSGVDTLGSTDTYVNEADAASHPCADPALDTNANCIIITATQCNSSLGGITPAPGYTNEYTPDYALVQSRVSESALTGQTATEAVIQKADGALYEAKRAGRHQWRLAEVTSHSPA